MHDCRPLTADKSFGFTQDAAGGRLSASVILEKT